MKYLLVFLVVMVVAWRWRSSRTEKMMQPKAAPVDTPLPITMVRCAHCGLHLPASEAIAGKRGPYCSAAHQAIAER